MFASMSQRRFLRNLGVAALAFVLLGGIGFSVVATQEGPKRAVPSARDILGPASVVPLADQPPAELIVDPPLPEPLAKGVVVVQYRTENLQLVPVFGPEALAVSPRIGHLHVSVDDTPWVWGSTSGEPLIINGLSPGPHKVTIDLVNANHKSLEKRVVKFDVPKQEIARPALAALDSQQPPAKLIVEAPQADALAHGVVIIKYRTENLQIAPVFGPAALAIKPRIGHLHITVDDLPWRWANASGESVIVGGLPPGPHRIQIELADANHRPLARDIVKFDVTGRYKP